MAKGLETVAHRIAALVRLVRAVDRHNIIVEFRWAQRHLVPVDAFNLDDDVHMRPAGAHPFRPSPSSNLAWLIWRCDEHYLMVFANPVREITTEEHNEEIVPTRRLRGHVPTLSCL